MAENYRILETLAFDFPIVRTTASFFTLFADMTNLLIIREHSYVRGNEFSRVYLRELQIYSIQSIIKVF